MTTALHRETTVPAFTMLRAEVVRVHRLSPSLVRITFGGPELRSMTSGGLDQRIKMLLPLPGQDEPRLPEELSFRALRALPDSVRPWPRTYTVREHRPEVGEFDVDFVLHGDTGPGSAFAGRARVGDRVATFAPNAEHPHGPRLSGVEYRLDLVEDAALLVGDDTALPAIAAILERLPRGVRAKVYVEVPDPADAQALTTAADAEVHWLPQESGSAPGAALVRAVRASRLAGGRWYSWIAGESDMVKSLRRHLVRERGFDRSLVTFMGYWRAGRTEDAPAG